VLLRDSFESKEGAGSFGAWFKATALTAVPTVAYAVAYKAPPPAAVRFGLFSTVLLHSYDRLLKLRYPFMDHMQGNRRAF
jgi:hypothetical protein